VGLSAGLKHFSLFGCAKIFVWPNERKRLLRRLARRAGVRSPGANLDCEPNINTFVVDFRHTNS